MSSESVLTTTFLLHFLHVDHNHMRSLIFISLGMDFLGSSNSCHLKNSTEFENDKVSWVKMWLIGRC